MLVEKNQLMLVALLSVQTILVGCSGGANRAVTEPKQSPVVSPSKAAPVAPVQAVEARKSKHLEGNEYPNFPAGQANSLAVIAQATDLDRTGSLPIVVRNNTGESVTRVKVAGAIRDSSGALVASGSDQGFKPNVVPPGEIAIGYVYFGYDSNLPKGWTVEFQTSGTPTEKVRFENIRDLDVVEYNQVGKKIVGTLSNPHSETIHGPIGVNLTCFDKEGRPLSHHSDFAEPDTLSQGGKASFQVELFSSPCPVFLFGGSGFSQ